MPNQQCIYQQWSIRGAWYRLSDALCIVAGLAIAVRDGLTTTTEHYVIAAAVAIIVYCLLGEIGDMFRSWRGVSAHREVVGTLLCWGSSAAILLALGFVTKHTAEFSRIAMSTWFSRHSRADCRLPHCNTMGSAFFALFGLQCPTVRHRRRQ